MIKLIAQELRTIVESCPHLEVTIEEDGQMDFDTGEKRIILRFTLTYHHHVRLPCIQLGGRLALGKLADPETKTGYIEQTLKEFKETIYQKNLLSMRMLASYELESAINLIDEVLNSESLAMYVAENAK